MELGKLLDPLVPEVELSGGCPFWHRVSVVGRNDYIRWGSDKIADNRRSYRPAAEEKRRVFGTRNSRGQGWKLAQRRLAFGSQSTVSVTEQHRPRAKILAAKRGVPKRSYRTCL